MVRRILNNFSNVFLRTDGQILAWSVKWTKSRLKELMDEDKTLDDSAN